VSILVTGGAGFIGSNFIIDWFKTSNEKVINLDKLTYAANLSNLDSIHASSFPYTFIEGDICDTDLIDSILTKHNIRAVVNFAAESHVDRSIKNPDIFLQTNVIGTSRLLDAFNRHWVNNKESLDLNFIFLHVSTDEVFGDLGIDDKPFKESNPYLPNSPYSASKASSDHISRAYHQTYNLPVIISNCSNNYGAYQFPEKLIPLVISNALNNKSINIYGDGHQIRDWLHVSDHCSALRAILSNGIPGETYNIGGNAEKRNIDVVNTICDILDKSKPREDLRSYKEQITFIKDRPGHDRRYAVDCSKLENSLNWKQDESFLTGLEKTIQWYLTNSDWLDGVKNKDYGEWIRDQYGK